MTPIEMTSTFALIVGTLLSWYLLYFNRVDKKRWYAIAIPLGWLGYIALFIIVVEHLIYKNK